MLDMDLEPKEQNLVSLHETEVAIENENKNSAFALRAEQTCTQGAKGMRFLKHKCSRVTLP